MEINQQQINNDKYIRLLDAFDVDDANDIFNIIHQLKEENEKLKKDRDWGKAPNPNKKNSEGVSFDKEESLRILRENNNEILSKLKFNNI